MIVTAEPVQLVLPPPLVARSSGVHLSAVIRCLALENGLLKPEWAEELSLVDARDITDHVAITRICMGLAWEQWYIPQIGNVVDHPGEVLFDGIYMTPDGESVDYVWSAYERWKTERLELVVHEAKLTYKSLNTVGGGKKGLQPMEGEWLWISQILGYCKGKSTRFADAHVLYVCGDYSYPIRPVLMRYYLEFTQDEVDRRWELLRDYRDYRLTRGE